MDETCVRNAILQASEKFAMMTDTLNSLHSDDWAMIHWICNIKAKDQVISDNLLTNLVIWYIESMISWLGHIKYSVVLNAKTRKLGVS